MNRDGQLSEAASRILIQLRRARGKEKAPRSPNMQDGLSEVVVWGLADWMTSVLGDAAGGTRALAVSAFLL